MRGIFIKRRIFAYNFHSTFEESKKLDLLVGHKSGSSVKVLGYFDQLVQPDYEDVVVINVPWEIIRTAFLDIPPVKKESDRKKLAELEIRRMFDIGMEQIEVGIVPSFGEKVLALFVETKEFKKYLDSTGLIVEPDVAYPTILSEMLVLKRFPGYWAYFLMGKNVSGTVLTFGDGVLNLRLSDMTYDDVDRIVREETGFALSEIEMSRNEELAAAAKKILESLVMEIAHSVEREIIITVNTTDIVKLTIDQLDGVSFVSDSSILSEVFTAYALEQDMFRRRVLMPMLRFRLKKTFPLACLGLLYRGGIELGKTKSLRA